MSRLYGMAIHVNNANPKAIGAIVERVTNIWPFEDDSIDIDGSDIDFHYAEENLCGGESEEEFIDRVSRAIWEANGGYCYIEVDATYLESVPFETHTRNEDDYIRLTAEGKDETRPKP